MIECERSRSAAIVMCAVLSACAAPSAAHKMDLNARLASRDWSGAEAQLVSAKDQYGERNSVLFQLDRAAVLHAAGRYQESDALLDEAERRLEELYTRSVTKEAGKFLVNDLTDDFRGEPHERALLHVFRALNHVYQYRADEAAVEARKVSAFLAELNDRTGLKHVYRDDAFARYLSAMLFEDAGHADDARIARAKAEEAYAWYQEAYGVSAPKLDGEAPPDHGELVLVHYNGVGPRRSSQAIQVAWNDALTAVTAVGEQDGMAQVQKAVTAGLMTDAITVAFPALVQDDFQVRASEVVFGGQRVPTVLVEDVTAISAKALENRIEAIRSRAVARALIKYIVAKLVENETKKRAGAAAGFLAGVAGRAAAAATEVADTRCWATLPAELRMARVRLPAGVHAVDVNYLDANGAVFMREKLELEIQPGRRTYVPVKTTL